MLNFAFGIAIDTNDRMLIYEGNYINDKYLVGTYSGTLPSFSVTSKHTSGALTVKFESDINMPKAGSTGFEADLTCTKRTYSPDLMPYLNNNPQTYNLGQGATFGTTIYTFNIGNSGSPGSSMGYFLSTDFTLSSNDIFLGESIVGAIDALKFASSYKEQKIPLDLPDGTYYLLYITDYKNQLIESDELNNVTMERIYVQSPAPDISISHYGNTSLYQFNLPTGSNFTFSNEVSNVGNVNSPASSISYYLSKDETINQGDLKLLKKSLEPILPGNSTTIHSQLILPDTLPIGSYFLIEVLDEDNQFEEINENNNQINHPISVAKNIPDFQVLSLTLQNSPEIYHGSFIHLNSTIRNRGNIISPEAEGSFFISLDTNWDVSDIFLLKIKSDSILPENEINFINYADSLYIPSGIIAGSYYILLIADFDQKVLEAWKGNNKKHLAVEIKDTLQIPIYPYPNPRVAIKGVSLLTCSAELVFEEKLDLTTPGIGLVKITAKDPGYGLKISFRDFDILPGDTVKISDKKGTLGIFTKASPPPAYIQTMENFLQVFVYQSLDVTQGFPRKSIKGMAASISCIPSTITGNEERVKTKGLSIYPNPASDFLTVSNYEAVGGQFRILNSIGQTVNAGTIQAETQQINLNTLPRGSYFLVITEKDGERKVHPFIKN